MLVPQDAIRASATYVNAWTPVHIQGGVHGKCEKRRTEADKETDN